MSPIPTKQRVSYFELDRKVLFWVVAVSIIWLAVFYLRPAYVRRAYLGIRARVEARITRSTHLSSPQELLGPIPQPFSSLLVSMHSGRPQMGTDGVMHNIVTNAGIHLDDGMYIYETCRKVRPQHTLEVGFAEGFSSLYFLAAAKANGFGFHVAVDPFEESDYHGVGLQEVRQTGMSSHFRFIPAKSVSALPLLASEGSHFEVIFIDGDHRYDSELADFVMADALCPKGGHLLFHDIWMNSTKKLVSFIVHNRTDYEPEPTGVNIAAFRKLGEDHRDWRHFVDF